MQRVKRATAVALLPAAPGGGTPGYFALPNPGGGVPATVPGYEWYNGVQEEMMAVIEGASLVPDVTKNNQLATAIQSGKLYSSAAGGSADALTGTFTPAIAALINGMGFYIRAALANATTTPTFTPAAGTIAAKTIVKGNGLALVAGDIAGAGHWIELQYDQTLDKWVLLNPATGMNTITAAGDPTFADNSVKPVSTGWVRGAMSAIALAAGFLFNSAGNGYIKFPSWLGGWIVQWCTSSTVPAGTGGSASFPITFPNACIWALAAPLGSTANASAGNVVTGATSTGGINLYNWGSIASPARIIALGT